MLFKRGSTISAAEGGCQAEVGGKNILVFICPIVKSLLVACSMASAGFAACMGGGKIVFHQLPCSNPSLIQRHQKRYFR